MTIFVPLNSKRDKRIRLHRLDTKCGVCIYRNIHFSICLNKYMSKCSHNGGGYFYNVVINKQINIL